MADADEKEVCSGVAPLFTGETADFALFVRKLAPKMKYSGTGNRGESLETLFLPTFHADIYSHKRGGLGLGLLNKVGHSSTSTLNPYVSHSWGCYC